METSMINELGGTNESREIEMIQLQVKVHDLGRG